MENRQVNYFLEVKDVAEDGTFTGIASVYDVEDLGGDIIEKGAFKKTISENPEVVILWQHDQTEVIGKGRVREDGKNILLDGKLDLEDPMGQKAHRKLKGKLVKGLSIGFRTIKAKFEEITEDSKSRYIRRIQELKLWEVSVVTFPMLPQAQVTSVKNADEYEARIARLESEIKALQAAQGTAAGQPPKAEEPPMQNGTEPEVHSLLESIFNTIRS
jgi:HK97 family phage prohead protease